MCFQSFIEFIDKLHNNRVLEKKNFFHDMIVHSDKGPSFSLVQHLNNVDN